jgi:hypothetical protein
MLKWIRDARIDFKTGVILIVITLAVWAAVVYLNMNDVVEEFSQPPSSTP